MSRNIFGWSYPPGCSGPPDDDYEPFTLRCKHCKSFIGGTPVRNEHWECGNDCDGVLHVDKDGEYKWTDCGDDKAHAPHKDVWDAGESQVFVCKRCKKETKIG